MAWTVTKHQNNPVLTRGLTYDAGAVRDACVIKRGNSYICFYTALATANSPWTARIARATSTDLVIWTKQGIVFNPDPGQWDAGCILEPSVYDDGIRLHLFYTAAPLDTDYFGIPSVPMAIGYAYSDDLGLTFIRGLGNPILTKTQNWEGVQGLTTSNVYKIGSTYYMAYTSSANAAPWNWGIAYASALDGVWTKFPPGGPPNGNPVMSYTDMEGPNVFEFASRFYATVNKIDQAAGHKIDLFMSTCGLHNWIRKTTPLIGPTAAAWDAGDIGSGAVIVEGNAINVLYGGRSNQVEATYDIGLATVVPA